MIRKFTMLPGMTGGELIDAAQAGWPELPVLMVSGYAEIPDGEALGISRLPKPFRPYQLAKAIAETATKAGSKTVVRMREAGPGPPG
jgi:CheY-like chemotaxis protein